MPKSTSRALKGLIKNYVTDFPLLHDYWLKLRKREAIFNLAYSKNLWGSAESGSGTGSEVGATTSIRAYLPQVLSRLGVRTMLDAPCGDWNWMRLVDLGGIDYIGADLVPDVIRKNHDRYPGVRFIVADLTRTDLPRSDLILCRDCWLHLSFRDISAVLENFRRSGATWLLVNNSPNHLANVNQMTGLEWRHLNLELPPFNFPPPLESHEDQHLSRLTLWHISDLPKVE